MKNRHKLLEAMVRIFSLRGNDYTRFLVNKNASEVMRENWSRLGERLKESALKIDNELSKR